MGNLTADILFAGHLRRKIGDDIHRHLLVLPAGCVHAIQGTAGFENDLPVSRGHEGNIKIIKIGDLLRGFIFRVVGPDVQPHVFRLVGEKKDMVSHPGGFSIRGPVVGDIPRPVVPEIKYNDVRCQSATIAFERIILGNPGDVGEMVSIRRKAGQLTIWDRQFTGKPAIFVHHVELADSPGSTLTGRSEENVFSVRMPVHHAIRGGLPGETGGHAARCGHDVHIHVAIVRGRVRDILAVR